MLLERGANPDYALKLAPLPREIAYDRANDFPVMNAGSTPLQRAAYGADVEMMKLLLEYKANYALGNFLGVTPLIALTSTITLLVFATVNFALWQLQRVSPRSSGFRVPRPIPPIAGVANIALAAAQVLS